MSNPKFDVATILKLIDAMLKLKDVISTEIAKEKDAKKRKKYAKAMDKVLADPSVGNLFALRELLYKL